MRDLTMKSEIIGNQFYTWISHLLNINILKNGFKLISSFSPVVSSPEPVNGKVLNQNVRQNLSPGGEH